MIQMEKGHNIELRGKGIENANSESTSGSIEVCGGGGGT